MSEASQLKSECVSGLLEIQSQRKRKRSPDDEGEQDLAGTGEVKQNESESDDEPGLEEWVRFYRRGNRKRQKWYGDGSRADLDESINLLSTAVSLCPSSESERDDILFTLADALHQRYRIQSSNDDLQQCIAFLRDTLEQRLTVHQSRSHSFNNLARALGDRYRRFGDVSDLEEHIRLYHQALALRPEGHPDHSMSLNNLARALGDRFRRFGDVADLEEQISLHQKALVLRPKGHPNRSNSLNNLACALWDRYGRFGDVSDLEEQIHLHQQALALRPEGHPDRANSLNNLASALGDRYGRFGDVVDLEEVICLYQQALALQPVGHPDRSHSLNNLASAVGDRYRRFGDVADLEERLRLHQQALALRPIGHPDRSMSLNNLARVLGDRYRRFGDVSDLEEQICLDQQALALRPEGHPDRSNSINNLASSLWDRYRRFGDVTDLEECIRLHQQALALRPEGHPDRSNSLNNLAHALGNRYGCFGDIADLEYEIRLHQQALALRPVGHPYRSHSLNNLASAFGDRYRRFGNVSDLEECIRLDQEALALRPEGHPDRSDSLNDLANALWERYRRFGDVADLEECLRLYQQALALRPEGHPDRSTSLNNLAEALDDRYRCFGDVSDLDDAMSHFRSGALDMFSPRAVALKCSFRWIEFAKKHDHHSLDDAFKVGVANLRQYLSIRPTTQLQYEALLRETRTASLPIDAAIHFIEKGRIEEAIELLDEGRALLSSEMRRYRETLTAEERARIGEELSIRYVDICRDLRELSNAEVRFETFSNSSIPASESKLADKSGSQSNIAYGELLKEKRLKMEAYTDVLQQIRQLPGCEDFQCTPRFSKLKHAADGGPVVVINCSERRSDIIIVFSHRAPLLIPLDDNFYELMRETYVVFLEQIAALKTKRDVASAISSFVAPIAKLLWKKLVRQVIEALQDNGVERGSRIWWCPTSFLTSLPIHAAGYGSEWLIDYYVSSYTPTLNALISARQAEKTQVPSIPRILVVAQTKTSGLKNAARELEEMQTLPSFRECLDEERATPQSVAAHLSEFDWAQFICHGTTADNPFESYLHLYDGSRLTLNDIIKLHMVDAKFAFLAACHSAAQSRDEKALRDEVLHLAGAMQISGFRSVVGTMWQMEDEDGPRIARKFYEEIFKGECTEAGRHTLAATALWKAVRWLRKKRDLPIARWANYIHIGA